jgi:peptidoglycan/xylan/chitin deacetylase (PgdA/CDA1 family)
VEVARAAARSGVLVLLVAASQLSAARECAARVYLTFDTGTMSQAETIAAILKRHETRATFFLANERTMRGDFSLDASWSSYWKARADEGHAFGSHTWRHGRISEQDKGSIRYRPQFGEAAGATLELSPEQFCNELRRVDDAFERATGRKLDRLWRAPGGRVTPFALTAAQRCGYSHVLWAPAGFLGDELPSESYPNERLLKQALRDIRDGDVLMAHLGIRSRKDPFAPMLEPLIAGLKQRGFCFRPLTDHPQYAAGASVPESLVPGKPPGARVGQGTEKR